MTPEDRAEKLVAYRILSYQDAEEIAQHIREAEASARSKAFEEAAKLCEERGADFRALHEPLKNGSREDRLLKAALEDQESGFNTLAEKIRARAKDATS